MSNRHKVFISYHHALDEAYKIKFEQFGSIFDVLVPGAVKIGDIDPNLPAETIRQKIRDEYLRDTSVTVVLIGAETWQRKHIDWEIGSSIRQTAYNARSGLLGIILPTYPRTDLIRYNPHTIPPRLYDNIKCEFASIHNWSNDPRPQSFTIRILDFASCVKSFSRWVYGRGLHRAGWSGERLL